MVKLCRLKKQISTGHINAKRAVGLVVVREEADDDRKCCSDENRLAVEKKSSRDESEYEGRSWWLWVAPSLNHLPPRLEHFVLLLT